jgi:polyhydroxyalkanoate synthesis repressor PhaR
MAVSSSVKKASAQAKSKVSAAVSSNRQRIIKKYPNRRLYDAQASTYVSLDELRKLVLGGQAIQVVEAKSGQDVTRAVLLQMIFDGDSDAQPLFSNQALVQIIRMQSHAAQSAFSSFLNLQVEAYSQAQSQALDVWGKSQSAAWQLPQAVTQAQTEFAKQAAALFGLSQPPGSGQDGS